MAVEFLSKVEGVPGPTGPFSLSVTVTNEKTVYLAGHIGVDPATGNLVPGGVQPQARQCLRNIQRVLEAAGSSLEKVVKLSVFLTDMGDLAAVAEVRKEFWQDPHPVSTTVEVSKLPHPDAVIEIEAVATL